VVARAAASPNHAPWDAVLALPGTHLHLYGKPSAGRGRKMGHLNITGPDIAACAPRRLQAAALLGMEPFWRAR
jgi:5-(carboxyamino)imidazole ribonucleotide synthase